MLTGEPIKIKQTTIERGVRTITGSGGDSLSLVESAPHVIKTLKKQHDNEKYALHELNDRFAKYIDRVKFLEGQNKKLLHELDELRQRWGQDSRLIREKYEPELLEARATIDDTTREKALSEIRAKRSEYDMQNLRRQYDEAVAQVHVDRNKIKNLEYVLQENQVELDLLHRQMNDTNNDIEKYKRETVRLNENLKGLLADLDQETLRRVKVQNERQTLEEQIPFLNAIHEQEMSELRSLQAGAHVDPAQFYRHELERAIRDIRADFEDLSEQQKRELEEWYKIKTEEIIQQQKLQDELDSMHVKVESSAHLKGAYQDGQREFNDLKQRNAELIRRLGQLEEALDHNRRTKGDAIEQREREINELRAKLHELMADYDALMNNKTNLEFEINTYRRLLESEENHRSYDASRPIISSSSTSFTSGGGNNNNQRRPANNNNSSSSSTLPSGDFKLGSTDLGSKTTFQRSAKGPISILESSPDGKVIILENTSRNKDVNMTQWLIERKLDNRAAFSYHFPRDFVLKSTKQVRIWARGNGRNNNESDLVNNDVDNWGTGNNVLTTVINEIGEEKATHLQKTIYS